MRNLNSILAVVATATVFALFGGCGADLESPECVNDGTCPIGLVCCGGECLRTTEAPQICLGEVDLGDTQTDTADAGDDTPVDASDTTAYIGTDTTDAGWDTPADVNVDTPDASTDATEVGADTPTDVGIDTTTDATDVGGETSTDVNVDTPDAGTDATDAGWDAPTDVDTDVTDVGDDAPTDVGEDPTGPARYCVYLHPEDLDDLRNPADMSDLPDVLFTNSSGIPTSLGQVGECFSASGLEGLEYWVEETKPMYINPCGVRVFPPCESGECHLDYPRWVNDKFLEYNLEIQGRTGMVTPPREVRCIEDVVDELPVPSEVYCPYTSAVIDGGDEGWLCAEAQDAPGPVSQCRGHREECGFETRSEEEFGLEFEYTSEYYDAERWLVHDAEGRFERLR